MDANISELIWRRHQAMQEPEKRRSNLLAIFALAKKQIEDVLAPFKKQVFQTKVVNQESYKDQFVKLIRQVERFAGLVNTFPKTFKRNNDAIKFHVTQELESTVHGINKKLDEVILTIEESKYISPEKEPLKPVLMSLQKELKGALEVVQREVQANRIVFPKVQQIEGSVQVKNQQEFPIQKILTGLQSVEKAVRSVEIPKPQKIDFPPFPEKIQLLEAETLLSKLQEIKEQLVEIPKEKQKIEFPKNISVDNFPPQKYPMPVTSININPLRGFAKSRNVTVSTTPAPLPDEVLSYRRSLVAYNNSSTETLYVGGSDVSGTNGMPVPPKSYSPAFDAGPRMIVYGVVATGSIDVRVLELSNENVGA